MIYRPPYASFTSKYSNCDLSRATREILLHIRLTGLNPSTLKRVMWKHVGASINIKFHPTRIVAIVRFLTNLYNNLFKHPTMFHIKNRTTTWWPPTLESNVISSKGDERKGEGGMTGPSHTNKLADAGFQGMIHRRESRADERGREEEEGEWI